MENNFVSACKRGLGRVRDKLGIVGGLRSQKIRLEGGGVLTIAGYRRIAREAVAFRQDIQRQEPQAYHTNIKTELNISLKAMARDAYFESVLQSGEYVYGQKSVWRGAADGACTVCDRYTVRGADDREGKDEGDAFCQ